MPPRKEESRPKLSYFNMRGRAEAARLLLTDQDVPFDDHRVTSMDEWQHLQAELPFGYLPRDVDVSVNLHQSQAILRFLARKHGLLPNSATGQVAFDEAQEALAEAQEDLWRFAWHKNYKDDPDRYASGRLSQILGNLQSLFSRNEKAYWIGDSISHVDCLAFVLLDELRAFFPETLSRFEGLAEFHDRFQNRPRIRSYVDSRRRPAVFGMGLHGPKIDPAARLEKGEVFENPWTEPVRLG